MATQECIVGLTGYEENAGPIQPNFGSIIAKQRSNRRVTTLLLCRPRDSTGSSRRIEGYGGGTLGKAYDPFLVSCSEQGEVGIPTFNMLPGMTPIALWTKASLSA